MKENILPYRKPCFCFEDKSVAKVCKICGGLVLSDTLNGRDSMYECPFSGETLNYQGLNNINKLTANERFWDISQNSCMNKQIKDTGKNK